MYCIILMCGVAMASANFDQITLNDYKWLNEPKKWSLGSEVLEVTTDNATDFWQGTHNGFYLNTGHMYGIELAEDFTYTVCIEADFHTLYDQAGLMIYLDEKHWIKAGLEYNDGQPMVGSVTTNDLSDWAAGVYTGNPRKFWLRLSRVGTVVVVKYSSDNKDWILLRMAPFPKADKYFVGPMCCTPKREGLRAKFSDISITEPAEDILHSN